MVSRFRRYGQIADVLVKYGFGIAIDQVFPGVRNLKFFQKHFPEKRPVYVRMRLAIEELGPTFIKFGQIAATRTELLPPELVAELQKLQDRVAPVPFAQVKPIFEEYCGCTEDVFESIDEEPVGSASIALVYRGVLKDGTKVALKVQRPGIPEIIEKDLVILQGLARRVEEVFPDLRVYNPTGMVHDFAVQIRKELDFVRDGKNAERLARNMRDLDGIRCPEIFWQYSGARLLVMEYAEGVRIDDVEGIRAFGIRPRDIGSRGFYAYMKQIFEDGFFHGDPHPGNLIVTRKGDLYFLDFGIIGVIRPEKRHTFTNLVLSILENDVDLMIRCLEKLGVAVKPGDVDNLRDDLFVTLMDYSEFQLKDVNFSQVIQELTGVMRRYHLQVPMNLMLMLKVIMMVADIGKSLDPEFNFSSYIEPYMEGLEEKDYAVQELGRRARQSAATAFEGLMELPANVNSILKRFSTGSFRFEVAEGDLMRLQHIMDRASDRVLVGLITAALVVGSSLVIFASRASLTGAPLFLAYLVYAVAVVIGFVALYYSLA
ncbi:MAG TPA: AarF/UbiB family protein [Methanomicrobiales archaeon]|jgi:ubiquinone biosynthesis protein|nr:AarF/UbiB family protein [Methanomicrobiales archaeon]